MARASLAEEIAAVRTICREQGLGETAPTLLKAAHHTSLLITPAMIVARVQSSEPLHGARGRARRECEVATHLACRGAPALAPLDGVQADPHVVGSAVITLWPYVPEAHPADEADTMLAAATLDALHRGLADYDGDLPSYTKSLDRCRTVLDDEDACAALDQSDRDLLRTHYRRLRREVARTAGPSIPLHGDAHLGNLLLTDGGPLWIDFEDACLGPREWDIACLPSAAWREFRNADQASIALCADLRSVCVAVWCWSDMTRSPEIRDAAAYHLDRVRRHAG